MLRGCFGRQVPGLASVASTSRVRIGMSLPFDVLDRSAQRGLQAQRPTINICRHFRSNLPIRLDYVTADEPAEAEGLDETMVDSDNSSVRQSIDPTLVALEDPLLGEAALPSPAKKAKVPKTAKAIAKQEAIKELLKPAKESSFPHMPQRKTWGKAYGSMSMQRSFVANLDTCEEIFGALQLEKYVETCLSPGQKMTILEGYSGPGTMTRTFLKSKSVERVVAMENHERFLQSLEHLKSDKSVASANEKLRIQEGSALMWDTYEDVLNSGSLDLLPSMREGRKQPGQVGKDGNLFDEESWQQPSPLLLFAQLPNNVHSEQLLSQLLRAIGNRLWLYRYTRIRLALICSEHMAKRLVAQPNTPVRNKLGVVADAMAHVTILSDSCELRPHHKHFFPEKASVGAQFPITYFEGRTANVRRATSDSSKIRDQPGQGRKVVVANAGKVDQALVLIEPRTRPMLSGTEVEALDFVTKGLYILRASSVRKALLSLAPGAIGLLDVLAAGTHPAIKELGPMRIDPDMLVNNLTTSEVVAIAKIFDRWPFRPANLHFDGHQDFTM